MEKKRITEIESRFDGVAGAPDAIKDAADMICNSYGINGICDPAYIVNTIALALGWGDGSGNFYDAPGNYRDADPMCPLRCDHHLGKFCKRCGGIG